MEENSQNGKNIDELDVLFHRQVAHAARNPTLYRTLEGVSDLIFESRRAISLDPNALLQALCYHVLIAEALRSRHVFQSRLIMQGRMDSLLDEVVAFDEIEQSRDKI